MFWSQKQREEVDVRVVVVVVVEMASDHPATRYSGSHPPGELVDDFFWIKHPGMCAVVAERFCLVKRRWGRCTGAVLPEIG